MKIIEKIKNIGIYGWVGLSLLIIGIIGSIIVLQKPELIPFLRAAPEISPQQVEISNITDKSFTVSWLTQEPAIGLVKYGENNQVELVARDVRDPITGENRPYTTHMVQIVGLTPNSSYSFEIQSGNKTFDNNGSPYSIKTAALVPVEQTVGRQGVQISGTVLDPSGQPAEHAIVYIRSAEMSPLAALVDLTGVWTVNMTFARTKQLDQYYSYNPDRVSFEAIIQGGGNLPNSVASFIIGRTQKLPEVTLGQDYDFRSINPRAEDPENERSPLAKFDFSRFANAAETVETEGIVVWNPEEGEAVATTLPLFLGSAPPQTKIQILLESKVITAEVTTDDRGYWQWSPEEPITPGEHKLTMSYIGNDGYLQFIVRNFTVLAAGEMFPAIEASPSGEISLTPSPSQTQTTTAPTNSPSPTPTPTIISEISLTPTTSPTPTPTRILTPSPTSTPTPIAEITNIPTPTPSVLPQAGTSLHTIGITAVGFIILATGLFLLI